MFQLPRECRVFAKVNPASQWGWNEILQNKMVYALELLVWMKTKDAQKKSQPNRPVPFVPEFMQAIVDKDAEAHTTEDIKNILSAPRNTPTE